MSRDALSQRGKENCAWEAGTEARVPGGGVRGPEAEWLQGRGGLLGPGHQRAETSEAVPETTHTFASLAWSVPSAGRQGGMEGGAGTQ